MAVADQSLARLRALASPIIDEARQRFRRYLPPPRTRPTLGPTPGYGLAWDVETDAEARKLALPEGDDPTGAELADIVDGMIAPGDVVVDLGCGTGRIAERIANQCGELWLVDASERMLEITRAALGDRPNVRFARCHGAQVPAIAPASVDLIICVHVLDRVEREDAYLLLRDIRRMLRTGGMALVVVPNLLSGRHFTTFKRRAEQDRGRDPRRPRPFTPDEIERLCAAAALQPMAFDPADDLRVTLYRR